MGRPRKADSVEAAHRVFAGRANTTPVAQPVSTRELTPTELLAQPTQTLSKILNTLDKFVDQMHLRAVEGSASNKDVKALVDLVKAHATLRQTQLAEDAFARQAQSIATDEDVAVLLIEAVKAGGPEAKALLQQAAGLLEAKGDDDGE